MDKNKSVDKSSSHLLHNLDEPERWESMEEQFKYWEIESMESICL